METVYKVTFNLNGDISFTKKTISKETKEYYFTTKGSRFAKVSEYDSWHKSKMQAVYAKIEELKRIKLHYEKQILELNGKIKNIKEWKTSN